MENIDLFFKELIIAFGNSHDHEKDSIVLKGITLNRISYHIDKITDKLFLLKENDRVVYANILIEKIAYKYTLIKSFQYFPQWDGEKLNKEITVMELPILESDIESFTQRLAWIFNMIGIDLKKINSKYTNYSFSSQLNYTPIYEDSYLVKK